MNLKLQKKNILRSKKEIQNLIENGKTINVFPFSVKYYIFSNLQSENLYKLAVSVKKKNHKKAVTRNFLRRITKESFRINQQELSDNLHNHNKELHFILTYNSTSISNFNEIENYIKIILSKLIEKIISC